MFKRWQTVLVLLWAILAVILLGGIFCHATILSSPRRHTKPITGAPALPSPVNQWSITTNDSNYFVQDSIGGASFTNTTGAFLTNSGTFVGYYFDGVDDYLYLSTNNFQGSSQSGSISMWIRTAVNTKYIFTSNDELTDGLYFHALVYSNGIGLQDSIDGGSVLWGAETQTTDNVWHHCVWVSDAANYFLYTDGVLQTNFWQAGGADDGVWFADITGRDNLVVGCRKYTATSLFFSGVVDDVRVYTNVLSAAQVVQLKNAGAQ